MSAHRYRKANPEKNFGYHDLIYLCMKDKDQPVTSSEIWTHAVDRGYDKILFEGRTNLPRTPWATIYARMMENSRKENGYLHRVKVGGEYFYSLIPGRTPNSKPKLDYITPNCQVYNLLNPADGLKPFYVGMGLENRGESHVIGNSHSEEVRREIEGIRGQGAEPIVVTLFSGLKRDEARKVERSLIAAMGLRSEGGLLVNQKL